MSMSLIRLTFYQNVVRIETWVEHDFIGLLKQLLLNLFPIEHTTKTDQFCGESKSHFNIQFWNMQRTSLWRNMKNLHALILRWFGASYFFAQFYISQILNRSSFIYDGGHHLTESNMAKTNRNEKIETLSPSNCCVGSKQKFLFVLLISVYVRRYKVFECTSMFPFLS